MKFKKNSGFTLVELLVSVVLLAAIGTIAAGVIVGALRGGTKGNNINDIRQNGNYIISQMTKMISYALAFEGVSTDNFTYDTNCETPATVYKYIKIKAHDKGIALFSCNGPSDNPADTIASGSATTAIRGSLIDASTIKVTDCEIYCSKTGFGQPPSIKLRFKLSSDTTSTFAEQNSTIPFETTIQPKNF